MDEPKTRFDKLKFKIKNNRIMALFLIVGTIVIALSTFTNAAKNLFGLINTETRPDINGEWIADVTYEEKNVTFVEFFAFKGDGDEVSGTASLFRLKRKIEEGKIKKDEIQFHLKIQKKMVMRIIEKRLFIDIWVKLQKMKSCLFCKLKTAIQHIFLLNLLQNV